MGDVLAHVWAWAASLFTDARFISAVPAFVVSLLIDSGWKKAVSCAVVAFYTTPLLLWQFNIPFEGAPGVGVIIAITGVHGIVDRVRAANIKSVIDALRKLK